MARFIEADVIQKIATEAEWLTQTRIPYKGQIVIVSDSSGKVTNIKVGDGVNTFADLNYMFDFTNSQRISAVAPGVLPTPDEENVYMIVTEIGDYTFGGSTIVSITEDGYQATLWWDGTAWLNNGIVRVKGDEAEPTGVVEEGNPNAVSGGEVYNAINGITATTPINLSTPSPVQNGIFQPIEIGVYENFGGLELTEEELENNIVYFYYLDGIFTKQSKGVLTIAPVFTDNLSDI